VYGVHLVNISLLLIGQQDPGHFYKYRPLLPIDWRFSLLERQRQKTLTNATPTPLVAAS
jgi:hypothetical protein